ncbi:hypothetical protein DFQ27_003588 [Actinomortierella ambigua]|uniref:Phosphatidylglycerol/phosphatidylinositol transfer protein n=1 Tax=Actinomortierella ambigua TaxID=1343610 RepID=A0A9P6Q4E3_9FUNG|nr:hypothetical protein DFQ26_007527 [Actinomortierella ambigua]KAG0260364.1 hypothetical protein DFQ27_003588 [Actinomortierella ambigua]
MKVTAALASLLFTAAVTTAQQPTWSSCATGATDMTITSFSVAPYPLCVGKPVCAEIHGTNTAPIDGSTAVLSVIGKYLNRVVYTDSKNLCQVLANASLPCPVAVGTPYVKACIDVKPTAPVGIPVSLEVKATNGNGNVIFCQKATVTAQNCP